MLAACTCRSLAQETQPQGETGEAPSAGAPVRIGLAVPQNEDDSFWSLFVEAAEEAAADLGVELVVRCADGARERMRLQIEELCSGPDPVDAVIFQNFKMGAPGFLEAAESAGVPALMVNAGLSPEQAEQLGVPRSKLRWWVGEMLPDDEATGARLADVLIDAAAAARPPAGPGGATQPLQVIALAGVVSDGASIERAKGLARVLATRDDATLLQVIGADWDRELARVRCRVLLKRYPSASVVWAANDPMALGAVDAARDVGRVPGENIFIGGVDGTPEALDAVERGDLVCTLGGHFMEGAWSVVVMHDFLREVDFADDAVSLRSSMALIDRRRVKAYRALIGQAGDAERDLRDMSRALHPGLAGYDLELAPGPAGGPGEADPRGGGE